MRRRLPALPSLLLCLACAGGGARRAPPAREDRPGTAPPPKEVAEGIAIERRTERIDPGADIPTPTRAELAEFDRVWELYRRGDRRWPLARDRFKRRSRAAGFLLAAHLLRHYMRVNAVRDEYPRQLAAVKSEVVAVGAPCVPLLVNMLVLDRIPLPGGKHFLTDDITRRDCLEMLERIGAPAVPGLLRTLERKDLGVKGRRLTARALGGTRDRRAFEPLVRLLRDDPSWQVRADAAGALADLGDPRAVPVLREAEARDKDPAVVARARKARLRLLEGRGP